MRNCAIACKIFLWKKVIKRFSDHAANERTYLAWIRTAITIMAFGFLVEKFDIFIYYIGYAVGNSSRFKSSVYIEYIGLGLMFLAIAIITGSTIKVFRNEKAIASDKSMIYKNKWTNFIFASLMIALTAFLVFYVILQIAKT